MTGGVDDFWDFIDKIDDEVAKIIDDVIDASQKAADGLADAANSTLAKLGRLIPGESDAEKAIKKWEDEILPEVQKGIDELQGKVSEAVSDFFGNPGNLLDYASAMSNAKATLYQTSTLDQDIVNLGNTWTGPAYNSYKQVATEQSDALLALANNLQEGAKLTTKGADQIFTVWLELIRDLHSYSAEAISVVGAFADVGKALGAWIPAIADAFALIYSTVGDIALDFIEYWKDQIVDAALGWDQITAGFDGMPNNQWPRIAESSSDGMNDPGGWPS